MFKKIINFLLIFSIIMSVSTICLATDEISADEPVATSADENLEGENANTNIESIDETTPTTEEVYIPNDHYEINSTVTIDENTIIDGNAYIIAENVVIKGRIVGDLFVLASNVSIEGAYVYNNVFVCADTITIKDQGVVYQLYAACNTVNIEAEGIVYRDLLATASTVNINGSVGRDAYISADQLNIVKNETTGINIYNNLKYTAKSETQIPEGAVSGEVEYNQMIEASSTTNNILDYVFDLIKALIFTSVLFLLMIFLTPNFIKNSHTLLTKSLGKTTIVGLITLLGVVVVSTLLLFSYVAVSVSVALMAIYILALSIGSSLISICIANVIMNKMKKDKKFILYLLTLVVNIVIWLLGLVPFLNIAVNFAIALYTLGLIVTNLLPKKEKLKEISKEEE